MINLNQNTLLREIPSNLLVDEKVKNLAISLQGSLDKMLDWSDKINYTMNLEKLDDAVLDHLLWEKHITWSEGLELVESREQKIKFIENAIELHRLKGTPAALELVFSVLDKPCQLQEWFQYEGEPYHFKIEINTLTMTDHELKLLRKLIHEYKNVRSWLDFVAIKMPQTRYIELSSEKYHYPVYLPICGEIYCEGMPGTKHAIHMELQSVNYTYPVHLPISGEIYANEVMDEW